jgi:hypothetical protein
VHVRGGDVEACVDVGLASLMRALWERGIGTVSSCQHELQDSAGRAFVMFWTTSDMERFLRLCADTVRWTDLALHARLTGMTRFGYPRSLGRPAVLGHNTTSWSFEPAFPLDVLFPAATLGDLHGERQDQFRWIVRLPLEDVDTICLLLSGGIPPRPKVLLHRKDTNAAGEFYGALVIDDNTILGHGAYRSSLDPEECALVCAGLLDPRSLLHADRYWAGGWEEVTVLYEADVPDLEVIGAYRYSFDTSR